MLKAQWQMSCGDGTDAPVRFTAEYLLLIARSCNVSIHSAQHAQSYKDSLTCNSLDGVTVNVGRLADIKMSRVSNNYFDGNSRLDSRDLPLSFSALLQFRHLLALYRGSNDLLSKNDVADLTGRQ